MTLWRGFQQSIDSLHVFFGFCDITLRDWLKKLVPPCQQIKSGTETYRDTFARVFPRFASATCICFLFWLVHKIVHVLCDWPVIFLHFLLRNAIQNHTGHSVFSKTGSTIYIRIRSQSSPSIQWLQPGLALADGGVSSALFGDFLTCVGLPGASVSHFLLTI